MKNIDISITRDLLLLIGYDVPLKVLKSWSKERLLTLEKYAGAVHLRASDNPVKIPPLPSCIEKYEVKPWV